MKLRLCISTDKGNVKEVNQDSAMYKVANTADFGKVFMGVLCDGMGGLSSGEVASAMAVQAFENWFIGSLPSVLTRANVTERLDVEDTFVDVMEDVQRELDILTQRINADIITFGQNNSLTLGTTVVCFLAIGNEYIIINVGDSRVYQINEDQVVLLTHDQSVVQSLVDRGVMTWEQAENSPQKSVLLQCLGANGSVNPQILRGKLDRDSSFVLCSDGFWRKLSIKELYDAGRPKNCVDEIVMKRNLDGLVNLDKSRGETDNITAVLMNATFDD